MSDVALSPDSQATVLLCSYLALPKDVEPEHRPLSLNEWNELVRAIRGSGLNRPSALLGKSATELCDVVGLDTRLAERITALLARGVQLALEVDRLASRGIWILTRGDDAYPPRFKQRLQARAPAVLFGAGPVHLLSSRGIAVAGSRDVDPADEKFAEALGRRCAQEGLTVFSGGARGVDRIAMRAATGVGGMAVGILADSLERTICDPEVRNLILDERVTLVTPYHPRVGFTIPNAMARNKLVYTLADYAVVVASSDTSGGTRAGAHENLKEGWVPLFVRTGDAAPPGNLELLKLGGLALEQEALSATDDLFNWLQDRAATGQELDTSKIAARTETAASNAPVKEDVSPDADSLTEDDLFHVVWPRLARYLAEWRSAADIKAFHVLETSQVSAWLRRAQEAGFVEKKNKQQVQYRAVTEHAVAARLAESPARHAAKNSKRNGARRQPAEQKALFTQETT
jgi:predicted Rossmann fold nucleotide-binding protein DprA/Smf involved in DNA uptake